jgi:hypothetical protein
MIITIHENNFGGRLRNGDIVAVLNFIEHMSVRDGIKYKVYFPDNAIQNDEYIHEFRQWLHENTDYVSLDGESIYLDFNNLNLWDARSITGDVLKLKIGEMKKKICIFPLLDGAYNYYRNWTVDMVNQFITHYMKPEYDEYEKYICINKPYDIDLKGFEYSHDFVDNLNHLVECSHYVGGDTGMSHLVSVLDEPDRTINYYYGSVGIIHTTPFYAMRGKGFINLFWNGNYRTDSL